MFRHLIEDPQFESTLLAEISKDSVCYHRLPSNRSPTTLSTRGPLRHVVLVDAIVLIEDSENIESGPSTICASNRQSALPSCERFKFSTIFEYRGFMSVHGAPGRPAVITSAVCTVS